ncbi:uncharacterized protein FOMMEDRAFT_164656 [Fomitiporia mediterranea MF3/22]|uniref:uncharacterized protein n=1 Tax=Fomitiporia mediterranea (strain MF3/22) TaxID=694068 RepID=UPI000440934A|nr:uncharacterized protein FOMMEDRAFT_164656 [Fomitiporia mediterranea MF3/22]EJD07777.1 hypothetical protein FOMMEDRAFT_164656 [Fomitiporia mediterranea MF3/22]
MYADLDELVLSGKLFNNSRSSSPERTPSPDREPLSNWPNAEDAKDVDYSSDAEHERQISKIISSPSQDAPDGSIGMGPGRTGVKGVIRDRAEAQAREREKRTQGIAAMNARMERMNLGGKTYLEEERERELEKMMLEGAPKDVNAGITGRGKPRFGHLREVGVKNFVSAVEKEAPGTWVVVHLYDPSLDRCHDLDTELSQLARTNPDTKFLRARASVLGFASSSSTMSRTISSSNTRSNLRASRNRITEADDEDDPYAYDEKDNTSDAFDEVDEDEDYNQDADVDLDVLPTLLAYCDGELVHTWVRVDWEAGPAGVNDLLTKHHILKGSGFGNCGLPSDDEDLWDSDPN